MNYCKMINVPLLIIFLALSIYGCKRQGETKEERVSKEETSNAETDMLKVTRKYPIGDEDTAILLVEKTGPKTGNINQPYEYSVKVMNLTKMTIEDVELIQRLPENFQIKDSDYKMREGAENDTVEWFLGELQPEESKVIRINGIFTEKGEMPLCTDVTYKIPELCLAPSILEPILSVTSQGPSEALICDVIPIKVVVSNKGEAAIRNIEVRDSLPSGLQTTDNKTEIVQNIGTLKPGESREISVEVKADKTGEFTSAAKVVAEGGLNVESDPATVVVSEPVLDIEKIGPEKRYLDSEVAYDIAVNNQGDGPALSTVIEDAVPVNMLYVKSSEGGTLSNGVVRWDLGTLEPQDVRKVNVVLRTKSVGKAVSVTTAKANCAKPVSASIETEVIGIPGILLEVVDTKDPVSVGDTTAYTIAVTNQGSEISTNIEVACALDDSMQFVSSSGATKGNSDGNVIRFDRVTELAPKDKASWQVIVKANDQDDARFKVSMVEDCLDRPVEETESTNFYK